MTVHAPKLLTPEEFASLIEIAVSAGAPNIPPAHLAKLVTLGYVTITEKKRPDRHRGRVDPNY